MFSPIAWPGGKNKQKDFILGKLCPHRTWVEVFCGSGVLTLNKPRSVVEVINDLDGDLVRFFRVYQRLGLDLFESRMEYGLASRENFQMWKRVLADPEATEEDRAFGFWFCNQNSVNSMGLVWQYTIASPTKSSATREDLWRITETIEAAYRRLQGVQIECLSYQQCIEKYGLDGETLLYCDPPYLVAQESPGGELGSYRYYKRGLSFSWQDHIRLSHILRAVPCRWLLSYDDRPEIRALYDSYQMLEFEYLSSMHVKRGSDESGLPLKRELLIANYDLLALEHLPLFRAATSNIHGQGLL